METTITVCRDRPFIYCEHANINEEALLAGDALEILRVVPYESYSSDTQKKGIIVGALVRIWRNCTFNTDVLKACLVYRCELIVNGYPDRLILVSVDHMVSKYGGFWWGVYTLFQFVSQ